MNTVTVTIISTANDLSMGLRKRERERKGRQPAGRQCRLKCSFVHFKILTNVQQRNMHASMAPVSTPRILTAAGVTLDTLEPSVNKVKLNSLFVMFRQTKLQL